MCIRDRSYSFAQPYPAFSVDRTTGVIRMVAAPADSQAASVELAVVATAGDGRSSTATVNVELVPPVEVAYSRRATACRVREDAERGTKVCSLADTDATMATDRCMYYELVDDAVGAFWADPVDGTIHANRTLDRETTSRFRLTARVQLDAVSTRVVDVLLDVDVEDVNDCVPEFVFPSPGNDTVRVADAAAAAAGQLSVAVVSAVDRDASENGRVTYSIVANNSDARHFVVAASTGEVRLNEVDRLDDVIDRSFLLYVAASDQGRPPLQSFAVLRVILPAATPVSSEHADVESNSSLVVLAGVLSSFVVVAVVIGIAIFVVCRKSKQQQQQKPQSPVNDVLFLSRVQIEPSQSSDLQSPSSASSTSAISPTLATSDVVMSPRRSPLTIDAGIDYFQRCKVCTYPSP